MRNIQGTAATQNSGRQIQPTLYGTTPTGGCNPLQPRKKSRPEGGSLDKSFSQNCHPERSEGSRVMKYEILRCAQNDKQPVLG